MSQAFVAGATGFTGREVVRQLVAAGQPTVAHVRPDSSRLKFWQSHFDSVGAEVDRTPWTHAEMQARLAELKPSLVFALLGTTSRRGKRDGSSYESVDYGLTALLLRAAQAIECTEPVRFVYLSSMGVTPATRNKYLSVRHRLETELRDSGLAWTIARPSFIVGDRDESRPGERVGAAVGDALLSFAAAFGGRRLKGRYSSMTNIELGAALVAAALKPQSAGDLLEADALRALARTRRT